MHFLTYVLSAILISSWKIIIALLSIDIFIEFLEEKYKNLIVIVLINNRFCKIVMREPLLLIGYYNIIEKLSFQAFNYQPGTTMSVAFYPPPFAATVSFSIDRQQHSLLNSNEKKRIKDNETSALRAGTRRPDFR